MRLTERFASLLKDPPPSMAFEITETGIAAARLGQKTEVAFQPLKQGVITVSPLQENVADPDAFTLAVRALAGANGNRKRRDVALILPDYCARTAVLDFDSFPSDAREQLSLVRFRLKRSVPFDVESSVVSYFAQPSASKRFDVVAVVTPFETVAQYEAPFRSSGMNPGYVTMSGLAAMELAPEHGITVFAKLTGRVLTVLVRDRGVVKLARCLELPSRETEDVAADLYPTFVYIEDNLGASAGRLVLCGFDEPAAEVIRSFAGEMSVEVELLRSPLGTLGENNAGLLGYLRSLARDN